MVTYQQMFIIAQFLCVCACYDLFFLWTRNTRKVLQSNYLPQVWCPLSGFKITVFVDIEMLSFLWSFIQFGNSAVSRGYLEAWDWMVCFFCICLQQYVFLFRKFSYHFLCWRHPKCCATALLLFCFAHWTICMLKQ